MIGNADNLEDMVPTPVTYVTTQFTGTVSFVWPQNNAKVLDLYTTNRTMDKITWAVLTYSLLLMCQDLCTLKIISTFSTQNMERQARANANQINIASLQRGALMIKYVSLYTYTDKASRPKVAIKNQELYYRIIFIPI